MSNPGYFTFNSFLRKHFGMRVQKITLDAGLSCPHRDINKKGGCIYCNEYGAGTGASIQGLHIKEQIETQMEAMTRRYKAKAFIAYFQSYSNTYAPPERLKEIYDTILDYPQIVGLSIGTRPDCIDEQKLSLIDSYADKRLTWIEYGLQSASDETLKRINRGHDVQTFVDAVRLTSHYNVRVCAHIIIGLPGEGLPQYLDTARLVAELPITDIKIHLMYVVKETPLADMYYNGQYKPLSLDEYAAAVTQVLAHLPPDMVVQRITGDPHPHELVAPEWALEKTAVIKTIHKSMVHNNLSQGALFQQDENL